MSDKMRGSLVILAGLAGLAAAAAGNTRSNFESWALRSSGPKAGKTARRAKQKLAKKAKQKARK